MSTINDSDLLLVERNGNLHQITYDQMSTLNDDDILLVERGGVQYKVEAQYVSTGPNGIILPSVEVLTPLNGAGLNDGQSYTPMSSAYVSTDSTPIYHRYFSETITTIGGTWTDENNLFNGQIGVYASIAGGSDTPQFVYTNLAAHGLSGECVVTAYGSSSGGTIEVIDENDQVLRTYNLPFTPGDANTAVGIVRADNKIRVTGGGNGTTVYISIVVIGSSNQNMYDYVHNGRVAFEFTDDTDLDKMVAPIIQTDENGNVKTPTTSTVDSTTSIPGDNKSFYENFGGNGSAKTYTSNAANSNSNAPVGARMTWAKSQTGYAGVISDNVVNYGKYLQTNSTSTRGNGGPELDETSSSYPNHNSWNYSGVNNFFAEIGVAPKVLDIVSWTGDGVNMRAISHNLGTKPGMIIVKSLVNGAGWAVYHKNLLPGRRLNLHTTEEQHESYNSFASEPTKDAFYVGANGQTNAGGYQYVAYVFAADSPGKVKCGEYEGTGSTQDIDCGFAYHSGFVLIKRKDYSTNWVLATTKMSSYNKYWAVNGTDMFGHTGMKVETNINNPGSGGFRLIGSDTDFNQDNGRYIYLAIDSFLTGPESTQLNLLSGQDLEYFTTGTQITSNAAASGSNISFSSTTWAGTGNDRQIYPMVGGSEFFDIREKTGNKWLAWIKSTDKQEHHYLVDSERSLNNYLASSSNMAEGGNSNGLLGPNPDSNALGYRVGGAGSVNQNYYDYIGWNFLAAPQFFDIQKYVGNANTQTISHDLGVEPGFIMTKKLSGEGDWYCYHHELGSNGYVKLNKNDAFVTNGLFGGSSGEISDSNFTVAYNYTNQYAEDYISYIFAKDTPYVKCGKYTGAGYGTQVNVGFEPRWIMVKNADNGTHGSWVIFDEELNNKATYANMFNPSQNFNFSFNSTGVQFNGSFSSIVNSGDEFIYIAIAKNAHPPSVPTSTTVTETPDPSTATMVVNSDSFDVGATASGPALEASITQIGGVDGNRLIVDASTGTWLPGLYAKGTETTFNAPGPDEIAFTSQNQGTPAFSGVDATLASRTWTLESGPSATGPWTAVDSYVDYDVLNSQDGSTPWTSNKPTLQPNTYYRIKVQYNSTNAESVESVYNTFKTGDA